MAVAKQGRRPGHGAADRERARDRRRRRGRSPRGELGYALGERAAALDRGKTADQRDRLEEVVLTTWAALLAGHPVECPVCGGPLTAAEGCTGCGSRLS